MTITFAGVEWCSSIQESTTLLQSKGFTFIYENDDTVCFDGNIFSKACSVLLTFDIFGLDEVAVFIEVEAKEARDTYNALKALLVEKYGSPNRSSDKSGSAFTEWQAGEASNATEVTIFLSNDNKRIELLYSSSSAVQAHYNAAVQSVIDKQRVHNDTLDLL
jgi:hypothetical protein